MLYMPDRTANLPVAAAARLGVHPLERARRVERHRARLDVARRDAELERLTRLDPYGVGRMALRQRQIDSATGLVAGGQQQRFAARRADGERIAAVAAHGDEVRGAARLDVDGDRLVHRLVCRARPLLRRDGIVRPRLLAECEGVGLALGDRGRLIDASAEEQHGGQQTVSRAASASASVAHGISGAACACRRQYSST